jgi:hypothetical protein
VGRGVSGHGDAAGNECPCNVEPMGVFSTAGRKILRDADAENANARPA